MRPEALLLIASLVALGACGERSEEAAAPGEGVSAQRSEAGRSATAPRADVDGDGAASSTESVSEETPRSAESSSSPAAAGTQAPSPGEPETPASPSMAQAPAASAPAAASSSGTASPATGSGTVLKADKLYSEPVATARVTASVAKGANVDILAKQGGWLRVKAGSDTGWIRLLSVRAGTGGLGGAALGDVVGAATTRSDPTRVVAVAGLRGLNDEDLKQAEFNAEELARMEARNVSITQATSFASQAGLAARNVPDLPKPQAQQSSSTWESN